jgi:hypothetical protein
VVKERINMTKDNGEQTTLTPQPYVDDGKADDDGEEVDIDDLDDEESQTGTPSS